MNIIMHMGVLKTGTTALQKILKENTNILSCSKIFTSSIPFANKCDSFLHESEREFKAIKNIYGDDVTYIISNEGLYVIPVHNIIRESICTGCDTIKREEIIEALFSIFYELNIHTLADLTRLDINSVISSIKLVNNLSSNSKIVIREILIIILKVTDLQLL